ncbi:transcriptional regulator with XRE-family HTH domain [Bacilli bacterium PM5-9]|nr:transcriptional regulator with XRE-family HTH domain [Bacilli bacterium PM5-9]
MDTNEDFFVEQRKRLKIVLKYLKSIGHKQKDICCNTNISESDISHYKSGKIKVIPNDFLYLLHAHYDINPDFIRDKSNEMLDNKGIGYKYFEKFVSEWDVVKKKDNNYLYLKIDENFYNFLIELDEYRKAEDKGIIQIDDQIDNLKEIYSGPPNLKEYVLLPRNDFLEIVQDTVDNNKLLNNVIDFSEYEDILEE